ncbi:hypothetical protein HDU84_004188 [Entophlyctis sp. JEL0112]|nr:hypothetical protein HDU84_004188 [Entophlyctis sp. JEL0112]
MTKEDPGLGLRPTYADPVVNYVLLGDSVSNGIFAWITFGINPSSSQTVDAAAVLTGAGAASVTALSGTTTAAGAAATAATAATSKSTTKAATASTTSGSLMNLVPAVLSAVSAVLLF